MKAKIQESNSAMGLKEYIFLKYLRGCKNQKIADLGCGKGELSIMLKKNNAVCSVDIHKHVEDINYLIANLNKRFPLEDNSIDLCLSLELIEHLENPRHFLRECKRILKKEGEIIITTPELTHPKARLKFLLKGVVYGFDKKDYNLSGHITPIFDYDFIRIAKELNLKIIFMRKYKETLIVKLKNET